MGQQIPAHDLHAYRMHVINAMCKQCEWIFPESSWWAPACQLLSILQVVNWETETSAVYAAAAKKPRYYRLLITVLVQKWYQKNIIWEMGRGHAPRQQVYLLLKFWYRHADCLWWLTILPPIILQNIGSAVKLFLLFIAKQSAPFYKTDRSPTMKWPSKSSINRNNACMHCFVMHNQICKWNKPYMSASLTSHKKFSEWKCCDAIPI